MTELQQRVANVTAQIEAKFTKMDNAIKIAAWIYFGGTAIIWIYTEIKIYLITH
jgi:hypothetical protein